MGFGWAGAAAGADDALIADLTRRFNEQVVAQQMAMREQESKRQDEELALRQKEFATTQGNHKAQIALTTMRPGAVSDAQAGALKGTDYESMLDQQKTLPSTSQVGDLASGTMAQSHDAGGQGFSVLRPTADQEAAAGEKDARRRVVDLFKRGASRGELAGGLLDAGQNVPAPLLGEDPAAKDAREHTNRMGEIDAQGRNAANVARIGADARAAGADNGLVKVEHKGPDGRTVIEYLPKSEVRGKTYDKGVSSSVDSRLASAQVVKQTGDDMIAKLSDPQFAAAVGPAMGRYNTLRDFIGNPPPEFAELAGQLESYAIANMGVHGMRSMQGAEHIKEMLDQKQNAQSLAAKITGLNEFSRHFMENEGRVSKTGTPAAPTAPAAASGPMEYDFVNGKLVPRKAP